MQEKIEKFSNEKNELLDVRRDLESEIKDKNQKIDTLHYEIQQMQLMENRNQQDLANVREELKELRDMNKGLDSTKFAQEKSISEHTLKYQALQQQMVERI